MPNNRDVQEKKDAGASAPGAENEKQDSLLFRLWKHRKKEEEAQAAAQDSGGEAAPTEAAGQEEGPPREKAPEAQATGQAPPPPETPAPPPKPPAPPPAQPNGEEGKGWAGSAPEAPPPPPPVDARVEVKVSSDLMSASVFVHPPENGGAEVAYENIMEALSRYGVVYGLQEERLRELAQNHQYNRTVLAAQGTLPIDGENGRVEDHFPRQRKLELKVLDNGSVDFKNLNLITDIAEGTVICDVIAPVPPQDGTNIQGTTLRGRSGHPATVPRGKNTALSEDGLHLVALKGGSLNFVNGSFHVDEVLRIAGDVNNAVGNIDFSGDVVIDGDVFEGYQIRSKGNVVVRGSAEGASIYAGGDITLMKGMNGMQKGVLEAAKDIRCKFLESCNVHAGGSVFAESIINSNVSAGDKIEVKGKRGVLIGGKHIALHSIEAKAVGAASNAVSTIITLGASPEMLKERNQVSRELTELEKETDNILKDIAYLEGCLKRGQITKARQAMLADKKKQKTINLLTRSKLQKRLDALNEDIDSIDTCSLTCQQIYPPTKIIMGNAFLTIQQMEPRCRFYYLEGEVRKMNT